MPNQTIFESFILMLLIKEKTMHTDKKSIKERPQMILHENTSIY